MRNKLLYILIALLPFTAAVPVFAQNKPKTLKELIAEEKAQKEREKAEKAAQEAAAAEKAKNAAATQDIDNTSPEAAADIVTLTDSAIWAPTNVH